MFMSRKLKFEVLMAFAIAAGTGVAQDSNGAARTMTTAGRPAPAVSSGQVKAKFEAARAKFLADQQAKLQTSKDKVFAEADRLAKLHTAMINSPAFLAIQKESQELVAQYANASPADKAKLQARA